RDSRWHFGYHALRFLAPSQTRLGEPCVLRNRAARIDGALEITGQQLPVAPDTALQGAKVVRVPDGSDPLSERLALLSEPLGLVASRGYLQRGLLQAHGHLRRTPRAAFCRFVGGVRKLGLHPCAPLFRFRHALGGCPLLSGHWR